MGLLERVSATRRTVGRKSWSEPNFWDLDRLRLPFLGSSPMSSDREQIENDFEGYVEGIYKRNGPVAALMFVRLMVFSEARFQYRRIRSGRPGDLFGDQSLSLLETPWPNATTGDLLTRMIVDVDLAGNAYVAKVAPDRVRVLRPDWVTIVSGSKSRPDLNGTALAAAMPDATIIAYVYAPRLSGTGIDGRFVARTLPEADPDITVYTPDQIAHFAPIPDPVANWRGMSWLTPVLREAGADTAATTHKLNFFRNGATLQTVVTVDSSMSFENFKRFKAEFDADHRGALNAYETVFLGGGADAKVVGADLKQLDFKATQGAGESRLAAAAGVPPVVVGFSEGLAGSSLNAGNYAASRRRFADGTLRPLWRNAAGSLATLVQVPSGAELWYDDRDIAFLREDKRDSAEIQQMKAQTIRNLLDAGFEANAVIQAVESEDLSLLTGNHSGLFSVQLQPPGTTSENSITITDANKAVELMTAGWKVSHPATSKALPGPGQPSNGQHASQGV